MALLGATIDLSAVAARLGAELATALDRQPVPASPAEVGLLD
jgi:hypothetical protein